MKEHAAGIVIIEDIQLSCQSVANQKTGEPLSFVLLHIISASLVNCNNMLLQCHLLAQGYLIVSVLFAVRRFWNIIGEKEVCAVWKSNEEFCHIIVDTGIFEHHLPDSVLGAVERLYQHQISGREKLPDVAVNVDTPRKGRRAKTVGATLDREADNIKKWKKVLPVTYFYSNTKSDSSRRGSEPKCTIDDNNQVEVNEESIVDVKAGNTEKTADQVKVNEESIVDVKAGNTEKTADVNEDTGNTVDVNENTIEVTVHVPPEGENGLIFVQDTNSTVL